MTEIMPTSCAVRRLLVAWLVSAGGLLLGGGYVAALAPIHHARALLLLALVLGGWLCLVELGVQRALQLAPNRRPHRPARWLVRCYCGFLLTQGLGLAGGYAAWVQTDHLRHPGLVLRPAALTATKAQLLLAPR